MIFLTNGNIQNPNGLFQPFGSIVFQLNMDARVIAPPYGQVPAQLSVVFQLDANGNLIPPARLWSNEELAPQNATGLATYYLVTAYDSNGARINKSPMWWIFPNNAGDTVDISTMTLYNI